MRCAECGTESTAGRKFCSECGNLLPRGCPHCGAQNAPAAKFCGECGAQVAVPLSASEPETSPAQPRGIAGERRHLTVLFCDLVASTEIAARLHPEDGREVEIQHLRSACVVASGFRGHV